MNFIKVAGIAVAAFLLGFGAYRGFLEVVGLQPVKISEYVLEKEHREKIRSLEEQVSTLKEESGPRVIYVLEGTYGHNHTAIRNNDNKNLQDECNGKRECSYLIDVTRVGDPAPKREKNYIARWLCAPPGLTDLKNKTIPPEAHGNLITLSCQ